MSIALTPTSSVVHDVESWNHKILSFRWDDFEPASFDRRIEQGLAALLDPEDAFGDLGAGCDVFHCSSYFPTQ